jgi:Zn finger protein HypA/HybF involved in hydrogenase expression
MSFPPPNYIPAESTIPGIEIYKPAPQEERHQQVISFKCPQCDGTTGFNALDGGLTCGYCGFHEPPKKAIVGKGAQEFEFTVETVERAAHGWGVERADLFCQRCGSHTAIPPESLTHTCPFCGSNNVIQQKAPQDALRPRFLIPFKIESEACQKIAREWLGSNWMTPGAMKRLARVADFAPVFIPFWTFDSQASAAWKAEVGHTQSSRSYNSRTKSWTTTSKTVWKWESGSVKHFFDDLVVSGSTKLSKRLLSQIEQFNLNDLLEYEPKFLAGQQAQAYDLPLDQAWETARHQMREATRQACRKQASTSKIRNFSMNLDFSDESWRYILLPVYIAIYHYQQTQFQVMVNGQTGAISGQRPADWVKVGLVMFAAMSPALFTGLAGIILLFFGGLGFPVLMVAFVLAVAGVLISLNLFKKAQELDDA